MLSHKKGLEKPINSPSGNENVLKGGSVSYGLEFTLFSGSYTRKRKKVRVSQKDGGCARGAEIVALSAGMEEKKK